MRRYLTALVDRLSPIRLVVAVLAAAACCAAMQLQSPAPVAAMPAPNDSGAVLNFAVHQLNKPYRLGATGPRRYDCSGLVYRTFRQEGLASKIGGERTARGYYHWFKSRGQLTRHPQKGDLVAWAHRGKAVSHIGIFDGYNRSGQPMAISALINPYGVSRHRVFGINVPLKAYLHVKMTR